MNETKLLIADHDLHYATLVKDYLSQTSAFAIVGLACDGYQALEMIRQYRPDMILMDMLLPRLDGLTLLKEISSMKHSPLAVCQSDFYSEAVVESARRNGAAYYMCRTVELHALRTVLLECADYFRQTRLRQESEQALRESAVGRDVYLLMREMGFSRRYSGYAYISAAVQMVQHAPLLLNNMSGGLYRLLAEHYHTSQNCIERSMRTAIAAARASGKLGKFVSGAPTNKTCIRYILQHLNLKAQDGESVL